MARPLCIGRLTRWLFDCVRKQGSTIGSPWIRKSGVVIRNKPGEALLHFFHHSGRPHHVALISTPGMIGDLFAVANGAALNSPYRLHRKPVAAQLNLRRSLITLGSMANAFRMSKAADFDLEKKYPLILNIHGRPHLRKGGSSSRFHGCGQRYGFLSTLKNPPRLDQLTARLWHNVIQYHYSGRPIIATSWPAWTNS